MDSRLAIFIAIFGALTAFVVVLRIRQTNPNIRGPALLGTALVLSAQQAMGPKVEGRSTPIRIGLRVEVPGRQPYEVTVRRDVDLIHLSRLQPGATIPVQVDATNPQKVRIDFTRPVP
jgi:hypothetical protein